MRDVKRNTVPAVDIGRVRTRIRSWTPISRADRNRLRRGEDLRVVMWLSVWCSSQFADWERRVMGGRS